MFSNIIYMLMNRGVAIFKDTCFSLSWTAELGEALEFYVAGTWPDGIVRIVRNQKTEGIPRARIQGAKAATGDVIIFIDAHCEVTIGW